ncbi:MAG: serine--tRNA ligase [Candidatus Bathyarchaeota archaeon]|nr:MAG: serine--tRNA ligase [Candidatus Bathyarchaeota archaeon]
MPLELGMRLVCTLMLSKDAEEAKNEVEKFVTEANEALLQRGAPSGKEKEASRITDWSLKGSELTVTIESGAYVRATAAVLRIKKELASRLGRKFKIGIRTLNIIRFEVIIPIAQKPAKDFAARLEALPEIQNVDTQEDSLHLIFNPFGESGLKENVTDRIISLAEEMLERKENTERKAGTEERRLPVIQQGSQKPIKFNKDPVEIALELGWIKEFPAKGQWIYTTPYARLFELIKSMLVEEVATKLGFEPFMLPKLIPFEVMKKMPGYLDDIPEGMFYVCPPPRDPEAFTQFKELFRVRKKVPTNELRKVLKEPTYVLSPAQCEPFWQFYGHETVRAENLPFKHYDCSGWTYRWEGGGAEGLTRVQEFQRIELTYLGIPDQIVNIRDSIVDKCVQVADKLLELEWRVTAATPFYLRQAEVPANTSDSRNVSAYDLEIYMPYRGPRETAEWLEVAGCFVHKTRFIYSFRVREAKGHEIWTGCTGLGLSRWVAAFLAEHGFNKDDWPKNIGESFGDFKLPKMVMWPKR